MAKIVKFKDIPLDDLEIGKGQVRLRDVGRDIDELADSIRKVGLLEPIVVAPPGSSGKYEIILGQRRFLAHRELGLATITAGVLSERVEEIKAKVLSVTENLVRRDLNRKDLIDVCTYLYKQYGTMKDVADETGLSSERVSEYVKYDRLSSKLKKVVDSGDAKLGAALRAQDALSIEGEPDSQEAVKLATEMSRMSGAQQQRIQKELKELADPTASVDEVIEQAKSGSKVTQLTVTLGQQARNSLQHFASDEGTSMAEAAAQLIENGLSLNGYDMSGSIE